MTLWNATKFFFNGYSVGDTIYRKDFILFIKNIRHRQSEASLDTYRRYLTVVGYLEHIGCGKYKLIKKIPNELTKNGCIIKAYGTSLECKVKHLLNVEHSTY